MKILCTTLFDITRTGASNRRQHLDQPQYVTTARNQQSNYETVIQVISLRSQPEEISVPVILETSPALWGTNYSGKKFKTWQFTFTVENQAVYSGTGGILENLFNDCQGVPMAVGLGESLNLPQVLDTTPVYKNINFTVESSGQN